MLTLYYSLKIYNIIQNPNTKQNLFYFILEILSLNQHPVSAQHSHQILFKMNNGLDRIYYHN